MSADALEQTRPLHHATAENHHTGREHGDDPEEAKRYVFGLELPCRVIVR